MTRNNPPINLLDAWGGWDNIVRTGYGIFDNLEELYQLPWWEYPSAFRGKVLDYEYFGNHSGNKKCSSLLYNLMGDNTQLDGESKGLLIELIYDKFYLTWVALWNTYDIGVSDNYHPLRNFDITESGSHGKSDSITGSNSKNGTVAKNGSDGTATTYSDSGSENNNRFGFNSSEAVPTDGSTNSNIGNSNVNKTTSEQEATTEDEQISRVENEEGTYSKQFSGTKDVIKADIIKKEREIWVTNYFDTVFKDVDSVLTSTIYNRTHRSAPHYFFPFGYNNI